MIYCVVLFIYVVNSTYKTYMLDVYICIYNNTYNI